MVKRVKFQCSDSGCKKLFDTEPKRDTHERLIHKHDASAIIPTVDYTSCNECDFVAKSPHGLTTHKLRKHNDRNWSGVPVRLRAGKAVLSTDIGPVVVDKDVRSALEKAIKENIRLNGELEKTNDTLYNMYEKYEPDGKPGKAVVRVADETDHLRALVFGNPNGVTEEERLGIQHVLQITVAANEDLRSQVQQAKAGLIPDQWLTDIKTELQTSIDMIVDGMKDTVKERSKVVKYDKLKELLNEVTDD
jgi:hypothetical protein